MVAWTELDTEFIEKRTYVYRDELGRKVKIRRTFINGIARPELDTMSKDAGMTLTSKDFDTLPNNTSDD